MELRELKATYTTLSVDVPAWYATKITQSSVVAEIMRPMFADAPDESVWAIYVDGSNQALSVSLIGVGGPGESSCSVQKVLRNALLCNARATIIVHNHPSGDTTPSAGDRVLTETLAKASDLLSIPLLDHVILGQAGHYSFCDHGLIADYLRRAK